MPLAASRKHHQASGHLIQLPCLPWFQNIHLDFDLDRFNFQQMNLILIHRNTIKPLATWYNFLAGTDFDTFIWILSWIDSTFDELICFVEIPSSPWPPGTTSSSPDFNWFGFHISRQCFFSCISIQSSICIPHASHKGLRSLVWWLSSVTNANV